VTVKPEPTCAGFTAANDGATPIFGMAMSSDINAAKGLLPFGANLRRVLINIFHSPY
jgi:hypothetical protein